MEILILLCMRIKANLFLLIVKDSFLNYDYFLVLHNKLIKYSILLNYNVLYLYYIIYYNYKYNIIS